MKFMVILIISDAFAERLTVDMYVESLSPYCNQLLLPRLKMH